VLRWQASEVAELLETSVASVNSALQRAPRHFAAVGIEAGDPSPPLDEDDRSCSRATSPRSRHTTWTRSRR
jgi:RNA polymerase sigma-70 factor (ECF subfamily)